MFKLFSLGELLLLLRCSVRAVTALTQHQRKKRAHKVRALFAAVSAWFLLNNSEMLAFLGVPLLDSICVFTEAVGLCSVSSVSKYLLEQDREE